MPDSRTRAQRNRQIRKDSLREWLKQQGLHSQAVILIGKIPNVETKFELDRLCAQIDRLLKLSDKYIPNLQAVEVTGEMTQNHVISSEPLSEHEWEKKYSVGTAEGAAEVTH